MKVKPLKNRIIVKNDKPETTTASGIILPETNEKLETAIVTEIGPGTSEEPMEFKVGDKILHDKYAGTAIKIDGVDYLVLKTDQVIAIIEE